MADLADLTIGLGVDTSGLDSGFDKVPSMAEDAVDDTESVFEGMGGKLATAAKVAGAAAGAALVAGVAGAVNIEGASNKLTAQLGLTASESERVGKLAGGLYRDAYGGSLEEVNASIRGVATNIGDLGSFSDDALEGMSVKALDLASVMGEDVDRVTRGVGQLIRNDLAPNATEAFDLITAAAQRLPESMQGELIDTIEEYGADLSSLGLTGEQAIGALSAAVGAGARNVDLAADAFREFSIRAIDGSESSAEAFEDLGFDADEMSAKIAAGGPAAATATSEIIRALGDMEDPLAQEAAGVALFGTRFEELGADAITAMDPMVDSLGNVAGAADQMGTDLNSGAGVALETLKRSFFGVATDVGSLFLPALAEGAQALTGQIGPAVETVSEFINEDLIPAVGKAVDWVERWQTPIKVVSGLLVASYIPAIVRSGVASTISAAKQVWSWTVTRAAAIKTVALAPVHAAMMVGSWIAQGVAATVNAARVVAGWVAMGVAATVNAAKVAAGWVFGFITSAGAALASMATTTAAFIAHYAKLGAKSLLSAGKVALSWIIAMGPVGWVIAGVVGLVALIIANWDKVVSFTRAMGEKVAAIFIGLRDSVVEKVEALVDRVMQIKDDVLGFFAGAGRWLLDAGRNIISGLIDGIQSKIRAVKDAIGNVVSKVRDYLPFSPAREGPLSGRGAPDLAGAKIVAMLADGMGSGLPRLAAMADAAARAAFPNVDGAASGLAVPSLGRMSRGSSGSTNINVTVTSADPQAVVDAIRRYNRTSGPAPITVAA